MPFRTERFTFYHIPRTGGSWVRSVLHALNIPYQQIGDGHGTPDDSPPDNFSFTVIREPDAWLKSWRRLADQEGVTWGWPVPDWMLNATTPDEARFVMRQYTKGCDSFITTEFLKDGLQQVFKQCGMDHAIPDIPPTKDHATYPDGWIKPTGPGL